MSEFTWLNLEELVHEMLDVSRTPLIGPQQLAAWGETFPCEELEAFLNAWRLPRAGMPWSLWQWTDEIKLGHAVGNPLELAYLERGHVFGVKGDLQLRRDGDGFLWQFTGDTAVAMPAGFPAGNYWDAHPGWTLRPYERTALLWGEDARDEGVWRENRVGRAKLIYPGMKGNQVVQVRYVEYLRGGNVELTRLLALEKGPDRPKGGPNA
jgi:hypothetical protein